MFADQSQFLLHPSYKLFLLGAFTVPLIAFFGAVYSASTGLPIGTSMFKSYAAIVNAPGVDVMSDVTEHKNVVSAVWINLCFFAGLLTFAVFLGLIVADIEDRLYEMRNSSAYPLYEQNHTLILNWNRYTLPILKSLDGNGHGSMGRGKRKQAVVVIANKAKEEMDSLIEREGVGQSHHGAKIITRSGCPTDRDTLRRAAAGKASSVIILQNDDRELDVCSDATELEDFSQEVGSLLSLNSLKGRDLSIVLQSSSNVEVGVLAPREDKHPLSLARKVARDASTKNDRIVILAGRDIFGRLLASSALQVRCCKRGAQFKDLTARSPSPTTCRHSRASFAPPFHRSSWSRTRSHGQPRGGNSAIATPTASSLELRGITGSCRSYILKIPSWRATGLCSYSRQRGRGGAGGRQERANPRVAGGARVGRQRWRLPRCRGG